MWEVRAEEDSTTGEWVPQRAVLAAIMSVPTINIVVRINPTIRRNCFLLITTSLACVLT